MKTSIHSNVPIEAQSAFTQVELLVAIMVVAMLAMLGLSATARLTNQTKIAQCSNNLHQLALSQLLYAGDNSDKLPEVAPGGTWAWDLEWNTGNAIAQYGAPQKVAYCPGTAPRFTAAIDALLYSYDPGFLHVIGYALTLPGNGSVAATNVNATILPPTMSIGPALAPPMTPSQRVLTADANLSSGGSFTSVPGGFSYQGRLLPHICPHLDGLVPAGGNVAMLDGHAEWRPFKQMVVRTNPTSSGAAIPSFYW